MLFTKNVKMTTYLSPNQSEFIAIAVHHKQSLQPAAERAHYS